nr:SRPBCC family protein [Rhodococcus sp. AG1013]
MARTRRTDPSFGRFVAVPDRPRRGIRGNSGKALTLNARAKGFGRTRIEIQVRPDGVGCVIAMGEHLASPPMSCFPQRVVELAAVPRNRECIRRLALLAETPSDSRDGSTAPRLG